MTNCFEPFQEAYTRLSKPRKLLSSNQKFVFHQIGLSDSCRQDLVNLVPSSNLNSINHSNYWGSTSAGIEKISLTTLDIFTQEKQIEDPMILEIDTEGHELSVLKGPHENLQLRRIKLIILETGFNLEDTNKSYFPDIFKYLSGYGYRCCGFDEVTVWSDSLWMNTPSIGLCNAWFSAPVHLN